MVLLVPGLVLELVPVPGLVPALVLELVPVPGRHRLKEAVLPILRQGSYYQLILIDFSCSI